MGIETPRSPSGGGYADLILRWRETDRILMTCDDVTLTYADCVARGDALARSLLGLGLERPARVAAFLPNGVEFVLLLYACARVGLTLVPISTWSKPAEIQRTLTSAGPQVIFVKDAFPGHGAVDLVGAALAGVPALQNLPVYDWGARGPQQGAVSQLLDLARNCDRSRWSRVSATALHGDADLAVLYTSGSTGQPKGVILGQAAVSGTGSHIAARMGFGGDDRIFSYFPLFFSGGLCNVLTGTLSVGAELVTQARFEPASALELIRARRCTGRNVWHDGLEPIAAVEGFMPSDLALMRRGLHIDPQFLRKLGLVDDEGVNMYGMTETSTAITCGDYRETAAVRQNTHGLPLPGSDVKIVRPGGGAALPAGEEGEICVRGPGLMRGYTDGSHYERIDEDGFFHTGDVGYIDEDGYMHFVGRTRTLIKIKGLTVQPEEIEATLLQHPDVNKVVVVGHGEGHEASGLLALVVLRAGAITEAERLAAYCASQLSSYKVPKVIFIDEESFPLSASMKIDRPAAMALANMITRQ